MSHIPSESSQNMNVFNVELPTDFPLPSLEDYYGPNMKYTRTYEQMATQAVKIVGGKFTIEGVRDLTTGYTAQWNCKLMFPDKDAPSKMVCEEISMDVQANESPLTVKCRLFKEMFDIVTLKYKEIFGAQEKAPGEWDDWD